MLLYLTRIKEAHSTYHKILGQKTVGTKKRVADALKEPTKNDQPKEYRSKIPESED